VANPTMMRTEMDEIKPVAWLYEVNGEWTTVHRLPEPPPEDAYDEGSLEPLYDAAALEQARIEGMRWIDGEPPHPWNKEWFIAITIYDDRVVLKSLPEEYTYDYTTADGTYMKAKNIKKWMQFPDSEFISPKQAAINRTEAEQQPAPGMVMDKGPWHAGVVAVYSDDFTHDVHLRIHGDFADDKQREEYAKGLALMLNRAAQEAK